MTQLSQAQQSEDEMPPFRSATDFPIKPKPERMGRLYPDMLQALKDANVARRILRTRLAEKKQMSIQLRAEIERLESDLSLEAETRMQLHVMNEQLLKALQEFESVADGTVDVVIEGQQVPRTRLGALIERLKNFVRQWRALKVRYRSGLLSPEEEASNG